MSTGSKRFHPFLIFLLVIVGVYLLYLFLLWLGKVFVFLGYNLYFFLDNFLFISPINPILMWGVLGLFIGSLIGTLISIKKYKLNFSLFIYTLLAFVTFLITMGWVNKPSGNYISYASHLKNEIPADPIPTREYFILKSTLNVRSGPSTRYSKLFVLNEGIEVELVEKGYFTNNAEWYKIKFNDQEGFVNSIYLEPFKANP